MPEPPPPKLPPLVEACQLNDKLRVNELLRQNSISASEGDSFGRVALHHAAESNDIELMTLIYQADPSLLDRRDNEGMTPLNLAVICGNLEATQYLLEKGADYNNVDIEKHSLIHWSTVCEHTKILETLLRQGALPSTPDIHGAHALHYATQMWSDDERKTYEIVRILLRHGASVNCTDLEERPPLLWAASAGNVQAIQLLLESGADRLAEDRDMLSALHCAASRGNSNVVNYFLNTTPGMSTDLQDRNGSTPLFYAVTLGHKECARLLLDLGANVNWQDKKGRTAAHCGAAKGQLSSLKVLDQFGASFDLENYRGDLPLHEAIQACHEEVAVWLLSLNPSNINVGNHMGRTPLHIAAASGNIHLVGILFTRGANINSLFHTKDRLFTPLDIAHQRSHGDVAELLRQNGGLHAAEMSEEERQKAIESAKRKVASAGAATMVSDAAQTDVGSVNESGNEGSSEGQRSHKKKRKRGKKSRKEGDETESQMTTQEEESSEEETTEGPHPASSRSESKDERSEAIRSSEATQAANALKNGDEGEYSEDAEESEGGKKRKEGSESGTGEEGSHKGISKKKAAKDGDESAESDVESESRGENGEKRKKAKKKRRKPKSAEGELSDGASSMGTRVGSEMSESTSTEANASTGSDKDRKRLSVGNALATVPSAVGPQKTGKKKAAGDSKGGSTLGHDLPLAKFKAAKTAMLGEEEESDDGGDPVIMLHKSGRIKYGTGPSSTRRYMEEKRIFQELANLKRMQIQYGNVQEDLLVKQMIENFFQGNKALPQSGDFQLKTFNSWEKFLYDQLKFMYLKERELLHQKENSKEIAHITAKHETLKNPRFRRRPLNKNDQRVDNLIKTYGVAPLPLQYSPNLYNKGRSPKS